MLLSFHFTVELHKKVCCFKCEHTFQASYCVTYLSFFLDILWLNCTKKCAAISVTNLLKLAILTKLLHTPFVIFNGGISPDFMVETHKKVCSFKCEHRFEVY